MFCRIMINNVDTVCFIIEVLVGIDGFPPPSCRVHFHGSLFIRRTILIHPMIVLCLCQWRFRQYFISCILVTSLQMSLIMISVESAIVELKTIYICIVQYWYYNLWIEISRHCELCLGDIVLFMFFFSTYLI